MVEDEAALWNKGVISCISINIGSSQGNSVQVVDCYFNPCVSALLEAAYRREQRFECLVDFLSFFIKQNSKTKKQDCMQTYLFLATSNSDRQLS